LPLYACQPYIVKWPAKVDGRIEPGWLSWFWLEEDASPIPRKDPIPSPSTPLRADIHLGHDGGGLLFALSFNLAVPEVHIQLDSDADGYYVGRDNLDIRIRPDWKGLRSNLDVSVSDASSPEEWPHPVRGLIPEGGVVVALGKQGRRFVAEVYVKRSKAVGLDIERGEVVGLNIYVLAERGTDRWLSLFEPYRLVKLTVW